jgi:hypothetical protein
VYLFGSIWGCPSAPKQHRKNNFLVVSDDFSYKNGPIDLVRGLFSSLDIGTNNLSTCRSLCTISGLFGSAQMPQEFMKSYFLVVSDYFSYKNGPIDFIRGLFSSLDIGTYKSPTCGPCVPFWVQLGVPKCPKTAKTPIFWLFWTISSRRTGLLIWFGAHLQT